MAVVGSRHGTCTKCHNTRKYTGALHFHILQKTNFSFRKKMNNMQYNDLKTSEKKGAEVMPIFI